MSQKAVTLVIAMFMCCGILSACHASLPVVSSELVKIVNYYQITGVVTHPLFTSNLPPGGGGFKVKATLSEVGVAATVSLIYTSEHAGANETIATGLTDSSGVFTINPSVSFVPQTGEVYVLEASKRVGGRVENNLLSVRTYIRWNGTGWDSMTTPALRINSKTTALAIIASLDAEISASDTIGTMDSSGSSTVASAIGSLSAETILAVADLVNTALTENREPLVSISGINGRYFINRHIDIGRIKRTAACIACNLAAVDLNNLELANVDLTNANLQGQDLSSFSLSGTVFNGANLANANLAGLSLVNQQMLNAELSDAYLAGVDLTGADLTAATLTYAYLAAATLTGANLADADLSYADFTGANLSGANLLNANIQNTSFHQADLSGATWSDGRICAAGSTGECQ